ncbi:hypothetical protein P171DRAFT_405005 [Karstenula rhodostoma CBS 690.94]|uniref:Uncharacterized protein n=1 Tax=Karstenula rhodostoma CBS 690.94 TaxID=1392251 RepID=A0A9P4PSX5_9PLEO|nr:hypothetical protein P171DRAFT_405005 [Karstenula rhodostoma CBS 690.94]
MRCPRSARTSGPVLDQLVGPSFKGLTRYGGGMQRALGRNANACSPLILFLLLCFVLYGRHVVGSIYDLGVRLARQECRYPGSRSKVVREELRRYLGVRTVCVEGRHLVNGGWRSTWASGLRGEVAPSLRSLDPLVHFRRRSCQLFSNQLTRATRPVMAHMYLEAPWSPLSSRPRQLKPANAAIQWACGRRGRATIVAVVLFIVVLVLAGARRSETLTSSYRSISSNLDQFSTWPMHLPHLPSSIPTSLRKPSSTALLLEDGTISHVPGNLHKSSPNFHLLLSSLGHDIDFCKTTMSAMIMNYPPPTIVNPFVDPSKTSDWEKAKLKGVLAYLENTKVVKDNDLVMLVDGRDTWFQLPSELMIRQYMTVVADANRRVKKEYGIAFAQTIIFGAKKTCEGDDVACRHMPSSILPRDIYHSGEGMEEAEELVPAQYLDAETLMGPVKDLRAIYQTALVVLEEGKSQYRTVQSVMKTLFGEQMLARHIYKKENRAIALKIYDHISGALKGSKDEDDTSNVTLQENHQYEFSIGLDYTHALFQPLMDCAEDELLVTQRINDTEATLKHRPQMLHISSDLPSAFVNATGPFWRPDELTNDPSPNDKSAYIDKLEYKYGLDKLPRRDTSWTNVSLIQNTYTGAIPATFRATRRSDSPRTKQASQTRDGNTADEYLDNANVTWTSLWYAGYERALLRRYFRTPQSPMGYHTAAVGGDLLWDQRGGRGGVWTADSNLWLPWGEVDGVCGSYELISNVFGDKKGVWFHEDEEGGGKKGREEEEAELGKYYEEEWKKDQEWMQKMEEERLKKEKKEREEKERAQAQREREKEEKERQERERKAKAEADKKAAEDAAAAAAAAATVAAASTTVGEVANAVFENATPTIVLG